MLMPIMISMTRFYRKSKLYYRFSSVSLHHTASIFSSVLLFVLFTLTSCEEKPTMIGSGYMPGTDFVNIMSDTSVQVSAYTLLPDSMVTNSRTKSYLGRLTDPYFGESKSDFVGQLRLIQRWPGGDLPEVDSATIHFTISGAKGTLDSTIIHKVNIYEINEILNSTDKYYSGRDPHQGQLLATLSLPAIARDTLKTIDLSLPKAFGEYLLRDTSKLSQDNEGNPFKTFFKGLYITMEDSPDPFLTALTFSTTEFLISVYYHNSLGNPFYYDFTINTSSVRYNRYLHNYTAATAPLKVPLQNIINKTKDTLIYIQAFSGVYPQISFQGIKAIREMLWDSVKNVPKGSINKARLTFSVFLDESTFTATRVPSQILMKYIKSDTAQYIVPDFQVSSSFFDGTFNSSGKTYSFNLASFMQEYVKGHIPDPAVYMYFPEGEISNVILRANKSPVPVKFELVYTKL
jgi:hypothetical protein